MNVLFYVEPLIEMGRPFWNDYWSNVYTQKLIHALTRDSPAESCRCMVVLSEALALKFPNSNRVPVKVLSQEELLAPFAGNYLDASLAWYCATYSQQQLDYYCRLMKAKLVDFVPDVIITFSPAPFFRVLFPAAVLLNHEFTLFSRAPYPACWHLDPVGSVGKSFLSAHASAISHTPVEPRELIPLRQFKHAVQTLINAKSPYQAYLAEARGRFNRLLMLPLQFSGYAAFDGLTRHKSQYDYMIDVFNQVDNRIGIVVTQHPEYPVLNPDVIEFMRFKYANFLYTPVLEDYYAASQYVIAGVDGLVAVSTSMAYQALIWDKKLIALGEGFCQWFADGRELSEAGEVLSRPPAQRDHILYWLMTRYAILEKYLYSGKWLSNFLRAAVRKHRQGPVTADFFDPIAESRELFGSYLAGINSHVPIPVSRQRKLAEQMRASVQDAPSAMQTSAYDVSIVLPVWNGGEHLPVCLQSLADAQIGSIRMEIIIVNNGSFETAHALFSSLTGDVKILHNAGNPGFAQACNQGAALAAGRYLWFVHPDTRVEPECLRVLWSALENDPQAAAAEAVFQNAVFAGTPGVSAKAVPTDRCSTACLLIRQEIFSRQKGFDPGLTMQDEVDFGKWPSMQGYYGLICPEAQARHEALAPAFQARPFESFAVHKT